MASTIVKVTDTTSTPTMYAFSSTMSADQLKADLKLRREQLTHPFVEKERLRCVGEDRYGLVYIDILPFVR